MTNKQRVLKAVHFFIDKRYQTTGGATCPLCEIFNLTCVGCPNYIFGKHEINPCYSALTFQKTRYVKVGINHPRRLFWIEALPILERLPKKAFTKKGYKNKYFKPLIKIDKRIYNEFINKQS